MGLIRFAGRAIVGGALIADGIQAFRDPQPHADVIEPYLEQAADKLPDGVDATMLAKSAASTLVVGGALAATGILARLGGLVSAAVLAPATVLGYQFWTVKDNPDKRLEVAKGFAAHAALLGGALLILAGAKKRLAGTDKSKCCAKKAGKKDHKSV